MNSATAPSCGYSLLVISGDRANMQLMALLIARRGDLTLRTARSGVDGLEVALTTQPNAIVLDTNYKDTWAKEVIRSLKGNPVTSHIPVIAVSTDALPAQIQAGLKAGIQRYLTKPYMLSDFMAAIDDSLGYALRSPL
jgi:CheY-like chemotaxis protein